MKNENGPKKKNENYILNALVYNTYAINENTHTHTLSWQNNGNESFWKREKNEKIKNFPVGYFGLVYLVGLWNAANVCIILGQKTKKKKTSLTCLTIQHTI